MKRIVMVIAAVATIGIAAPAFAQTVNVELDPGMRRHHDRDRTVVIRRDRDRVVRRDRDRDRWRHRRERGEHRRVIIER